MPRRLSPVGSGRARFPRLQSSPEARRAIQLAFPRWAHPRRPCLTTRRTSRSDLPAPADGRCEPSGSERRALTSADGPRPSGDYTMPRTRGYAAREPCRRLTRIVLAAAERLAEHAETSCTRQLVKRRLSARPSEDPGASEIDERATRA